MVEAFIVGNEVLLRGELPAAAIKGYMTEVKRRSGLPVTYADVWEFWLKSPELGSAADFITIHILPYWEDDPVAASEAVAHVRQIRAKLQAKFAGKEILIGEVGWPSEGRMRAGALPSPANQALVLSGVVAAAKQEGWKVNLIEAFDQPWKRLLEGTVGGYWGLFGDGAEQPKFRFGQAVSNVPGWRCVAGLGVFAGVSRVSFRLWLGAPLSRRGHDVARAIWRPQASRSPLASCSGSPLPSCLNMEGVESRATGCAHSGCSLWRLPCPLATAFAHRARRPLSPVLPWRSIPAIGVARI